MALVSTTTVACSSSYSYHYDHPLRPVAARSWCRPRSRGGGGGGGRLAVLARARGQLTTTPKEEAAPPAGAGERGRYSYEVDSLIDRLSNLAPRGSIARCLETAKLLFACTPRRCCSFYERYSCTSTTICRCCFVHKDQNLVINYYSIIHYDV